MTIKLHIYKLLGISECQFVICGEEWILDLMFTFYFCLAFSHIISWSELAIACCKFIQIFILPLNGYVAKVARASKRYSSKHLPVPAQAWPSFSSYTTTLITYVIFLMDVRLMWLSSTNNFSCDIM